MGGSHIGHKFPLYFSEASVMLLADPPYNLAEWTVSVVLSGSNHTARGCVVWHKLVPTPNTINAKWTPAKTNKHFFLIPEKRIAIHFFLCNHTNLTLLCTFSCNWCTTENEILIAYHGKIGGTADIFDVVSLVSPSWSLLLIYTIRVSHSANRLIVSSLMIVYQGENRMDKVSI